MRDIHLLNTVMIDEYIAECVAEIIYGTAIPFRRAFLKSV